MCEKKIREGKVLSSSSDDDTDEIFPKDWEEVEKPSKKKKRSYIKGGKVSKPKKSKKKICKTCNKSILENETRDIYMFNNTYHQLRTKEYCKKHESQYTNHKCKPSWCGDCGYLINYEIELFIK